MQDVAGLLLSNGRRCREADYQPLHKAASELHPDQLPWLYRPMRRNAVGKGFARRNPVGVNGDISVVHGAQFGDGSGSDAGAVIATGRLTIGAVIRALFDAGGASLASPQIVQLGAAHFALPGYFQRLNQRRVQREYALNANSRR